MEKIAAGIVLYNPELKRLEQNISSILSQVDKVILVDNGSINIKKVENKYKNIDKISIIKNKSNLGIAAALNQIVNECDYRGFKWVLTLDQDSVVPNNLIDEYINYINYDKVAIITPYIVDINSKKHSNDIVHNKKYEYVRECITSASLTNIEICKKLGCFDNEMFIDYVDFDYCTRVNLNGYSIIKVNSTTLKHEVGKLQEKYIFGKKYAFIITLNVENITTLEILSIIVKNIKV